MSLNDKYAKLLEYASKSGVKDLKVEENNNVLRISGKADSSVKDQMWDIYNQIDPDMRAGDLVMNIESIAGDQKQGEVYEVKSGDSLSKIAKNYEGMTWNKIYEANKDQISDPDKIRPGMKLIIPS